MGVNELTEYLKTAFEYKNNGDYKQAIDYFYKALAIDNESTEIMTELAQLYAKLCRYERSISFYEQILQKLPEDNRTKYELACLFKLTKDYERAEQIFLKLYETEFNLEQTAEELFFILFYNHKYGKIITSYNKYSKILVNSGILYYVALAHSELGNKNTAEDYFRKSFEKDEKNILAGIEIANRLFEKGQREEARRLIIRLLKYSENAKIYYLLGEIEAADGNIDEAIKYYSYAIKISPQKAQYYFKLAIAFSLKGFFKEAEESYCKAINLDSGNETYNYALAYMYYVTGKYDLAEKIDDFLLLKNSENTKAIALKILIMSENNQNQFAGKLIEKLEQAQDKDDFAIYAQSIYYSKLNLWEKAAETIAKAIEINKISPEYNYQLAKFNYKLSRTDEAEVICEKILNDNPKYIQAYLLLGRIYFDKKDFVKSQNMLDKVTELDKNISEAYFIEASIYFERGNYEKAIEKYKTAISIAPNKEIYYAKVAECYFKLQKYENAYLYYKEAAEFNITKPEYRYYMAKCCEYNGDKDKALSNYSLIKRLAPSNVTYMKDYAAYLYTAGDKKEAVNILKKLKDRLNGSEAKEITQIMEEYK